MELEAIKGNNTPNMSFLTPFPSGVQGVAAQTLAVKIPIMESDVLAPYEQEIDRYVTVLNEIASLDNRAGEIERLLTQTPSLNPVGILDLLAEAKTLSAVYAKDKQTFFTDLSHCLDPGAGGDPATACKPIIDNQADTAFAYYSGMPSPSSCADRDACFFTAQNTLARAARRRSARPDVAYARPAHALSPRADRRR